MELKSRLETNASNRREEQVITEEQDNFQNLQPSTAPALVVGMRIDMLLNYNDDYGSEELNW